MDLPDKFDVVVVGTGLVESLVAGACARAGKKVLHLDKNSYYGARNATFNLQQIQRWLRKDPAGEDNPEAGSVAPDASSDVAVDPTARLSVLSVKNEPERCSFIGSEDEAALGPSHRYNIDLTPQLLLCAGSMVDVLRTSGVANYLEFKPLHVRPARRRADAPAIRARRCPSVGRPPVPPPRPPRPPPPPTRSRRRAMPTRARRSRTCTAPPRPPLARSLSSARCRAARATSSSRR